MNPEVGQYVRVVFLNGTSAEGFVHSWSDEDSVLVDDTRETFLVIKATKRDVQMIKIDLRRVPSEEMKRRQDEARADLREQIRKRTMEPTTVPEPHDTEEIQQAEVPEDKPAGSPIQRLVDLRKEAIRLEKEEYFSRVKTHTMGQVGSVGNYAFPNLSKKPRPFEHPTEEDSGEDVRYYPGLSEMFGGEEEGDG